MGILEVFNQAMAQGVIGVDVAVDKKKCTTVTLTNNTTQEVEKLTFPYTTQTDSWYNVTPIIHWADVVHRVEELGWLE